MSAPADRQILKEKWEVGLILVLAALVYQPWAATSLPILDFSEFLPILTANSSPLDQFAGVTRYMATQGRFCPLLYAYLIATWNFFGMWAPGWHLSYFALNASVLIAAHGFFVRLGAKRPAVFLALAVWTFAPPVAAGWLRPTGEPIGLLLMIAALTQAYNFADAADWKGRAILIAALAFGMISAKEMLIVLLPAVWLMTRLRHNGGTWQWAPWSRRDGFVTGVTFVAAVAALIPIALVANMAPPGNYADRYGSIRFTLDAFLDRFKVATLPSRAGLPKIVQLMNDPGWQSWLAFPNLLWIGVVLASLAILFVRSRSSNRRGIQWPLLLAFVWLMPGVIAYVPWPSEATFYMLPFALGLSFGVAYALSAVWERRSSAALTTVAVVAIVAIAMVEARDLVNEHDLRVRTDRAILDAASQEGRTLPLLAAVPSPAPPGKFGWGRKLAEFGRAANLIDPVRDGDVSCKEGHQRAMMHEEVILVSAVEGCGLLGGHAVIVSEAAPRRRWPWLLEPRRNRRIAFITRAGENLAASDEK